MSSRNRPVKSYARSLVPFPLVLLALSALACQEDASCTAQALSRHPLLVRGPQVALPSETSVLIAWRTTVAGLGSVEYGETAEYGLEALSAPGFEHTAVLEGLSPGALYHYRIRLDGEVLSDGHVVSTVPADPDAPCRLSVLGDSGSCTEPQFQVAEQILVSSPDLVLLTGDIVYERGAPEEIDPRYFVPYAHLIDHIPFYASLGNHDVVTDGGRPFLDAVYLPTNDRDASERYYSFDRGSIHLIALDTNQDLGEGSPQRDWLAEDLAANTARWTFVFFHHPLYSSSAHGGNTGLQASLGPLFDEHRVDLVFAGHDHNYERTLPLLAGEVVDAEQEPDYLDPAGTIYIVTGGGGKDLYGSGRSGFTAFSSSVHHHVDVDVDRDLLTLSAIRWDGTLIDRMTLAKTLDP